MMCMMMMMWMWMMIAFGVDDDQREVTPFIIISTRVENLINALSSSDDYYKHYNNYNFILILLFLHIKHMCNIIHFWDFSPSNP